MCCWPCTNVGLIRMVAGLIRQVTTRQVTVRIRQVANLIRQVLLYKAHAQYYIQAVSIVIELTTNIIFYYYFCNAGILGVIYCG